MWNVKVLIMFCAFLCAVAATMDSDIGEDNFRMLSDGNDNEDYHAINDELPKELDNSKIYWNAAPAPETLPYESLDEFDKLKSNPPFPTDFNDETESEIDQGKVQGRGLFSSIFPAKKNRNKMDEKIRDSPVDIPENSKFHGLNVLNDLESE